MGGDGLRLIVLVIAKLNRMIKKIFLINFIFLTFLVILAKSPVYAGYCGPGDDPGAGVCESDEDCYNCPEDCKCESDPLPPPPDEEGGWVDCGFRTCPGPDPKDVVSVYCFPSCSDPEYCDDMEECPGDVAPGTLCTNDADCFPNNPYCPGGGCSVERCIGGECLHDCVACTNGNGGPSPTEKWGDIICPADDDCCCSVTAVPISWSTQNYTSVEVWRFINSVATPDSAWRTGTAEYPSYRTRNSNIRGNRQYEFRLYGLGDSGTELVDDCNFWALCPECNVTLPSLLNIPTGKSSPLTAFVTGVAYGTVDRVEFQIALDPPCDPGDVTVTSPDTSSECKNNGNCSTTVSASADASGCTGVVSAYVYMSTCADAACEASGAAGTQVKVRYNKWFQTQGGDVYAEGSIFSEIPPSPSPDPYFSLRSGGAQTAGVVTSGGSRDYGEDGGTVSEDGWEGDGDSALVNGGVGKYNYSYFESLLRGETESLSQARPSNFFVELWEKIKSLLSLKMSRGIEVHAACSSDCDCAANKRCTSFGFCSIGTNTCVVGCNEDCVGKVCDTGLECVVGIDQCRDPNCTDEPSCVCPTPTPCPGCVIDSDCYAGTSNNACGTGGSVCVDCTATGKICVGGACVAPSPTPTPSPTPEPTESPPETLPEDPSSRDTGDYNFGDGNDTLAVDGDGTSGETLTVSSDKKIVYLVGGDLDITDNIEVEEGGFLTFIVSGNITIEDSVDIIEGIYIVDGSISTGTKGTDEADPQLLLNGTFVAYGGFSLDRDFKEGNETEPAHVFSYRPDLLINAPEGLFTNIYTWKQVSPEGSP